MNHTSHLMGRQPILDGLEDVVAYELLFRSPQSTSSADIVNASHATSSVILNVLSNFGIREILGNYRGFINVDAAMLMNEALELLPPEMIGLELLEDVVITPAIIERCRKLKSKGFVLALDDHRYDPACDELYSGVIDIVKFDLLETPLEDLYREVELLRHYPVKLLAEKVDSRHVYLRCRRMGFELFQGYFFARPSLMQKSRMENSAGTFFKLMQQLASDADIDEIEQTFKQSPALTYKLLLLVNSVSFATLEKIRTVRHAITLIGIDQLNRWVQLALFADDGGASLNSALLDMAAVRAAFMEELAKVRPQSARLLRHAQPEEAFMVGTLSMLKDIYDVDMKTIVTNLNLSEEIQEALINRGGDLGTLLCLTEMIEQLELDEAAACLEKLDISLETVVACQKKAYSWRDKLV
ncbi:MAG: HDOD domain-containing protein [Desulfuromonadaceae bacterium]|nr:HDOD domain-containing protein [Desulfuromonadaceae bacterium]MDD2847174.1 HDOD domain-containing protein [Desulfuromonadaceae bacterium]MDD4130118.1 HDOD domain-containing protein [Desulfuromonadaceae bacterium]